MVEERGPTGLMDVVKPDTGPTVWILLTPAI